jgi:hypothetical protein
MRGVKQNGDHSHSIMLEVITDSEGNVICIFDTISAEESACEDSSYLMSSPTIKRI